MQTVEDRQVVKFFLVGIVALLILFFGYLMYSNSQKRSFSNVGNGIYIGDEYKYIKYRDKEQLEELLVDFEKKYKIKLLFYIIQKMEDIDDGGKFESLKDILDKREIKVFLSTINSSYHFIYGDSMKNKIEHSKLNVFMESTILMQLNSDLFDTAILDIINFFSKNNKI